MGKPIDEVVFICQPVAEGATVVPNSTKGVCSKCGREVWQAPSTLEVMALTEKPSVVCLDCYEADPRPDLELVTSEQQLQEIEVYQKSKRG